MDANMPPLPNRAAIEDGSMVEGPRLDFKQRVDLETERGKTKLVDDVVAMLTAGPGYLVIGVAEERGRYRHFEPVKGDPDKIVQAIVDCVQHSPAPRRLALGRDSYIDMRASLVMRLAALDEQKLLALSTDSDE